MDRRSENSRRGASAERRSDFSEEKALKGESQERAGVKKTRKDQETKTAEKGETLRAERAEGWNPQEKRAPDTASAEGKQTPGEMPGGVRK